MLADIGWGLTVFKNPTLDSFQQGFRALYLCIELNELLSIIGLFNLISQPHFWHKKLGIFHTLFFNLSCDKDRLKIRLILCVGIYYKLVSIAKYNTRDNFDIIYVIVRIPCLLEFRKSNKFYTMLERNNEQ